MRTSSSTGMEMLAVTTIGELATRPHARVPADARLGAVVEQMAAKRRGCVLVEDGGALAGIFTERDLLDRVDATDPAWREVVVRDVMTPHPTVARRSDSLAEAVRRLEHGRRRHLPIVDEHGAVTGLISIRDILTYIAGRFPEELINLPPDPTHER